MIKITYYASNYCTVLLEVDPIRPARIFEYELGAAIAKSRPNDFSIVTDLKEQDKFFRIRASIPTSISIDELKEMKKDAQEEFSKRITVLKQKLDDFELLLKLTKKEAKKDGKHGKT